MASTMNAVLALEDGTVFEGMGFGAPASACGPAAWACQLALAHIRQAPSRRESNKRRRAADVRTAASVFMAALQTETAIYVCSVHPVAVAGNRAAAAPALALLNQRKRES